MSLWLFLELVHFIYDIRRFTTSCFSAKIKLGHWNHFNKKHVVELSLLFPRILIKITFVQAASLDLLCPDVGEVCGGTMREERLDLLQNKLEALRLTESYQW